MISNSDMIDEFEQSLKRVREEKQCLQTCAEQKGLMNSKRQQRLNRLEIHELLLKRILLRLYKE